MLNSQYLKAYGMLRNVHYVSQESSWMTSSSHAYVHAQSLVRGKRWASPLLQVLCLFPECVDGGQAWRFKTCLWFTFCSSEAVLSRWALLPSARLTAIVYGDCR